MKQKKKNIKKKNGTIHLFIFISIKGDIYKDTFKIKDINLKENGYILIRMKACFYLFK